jgi:RNA polymerase sigma factor (sigma-70 family)
MDWQEDEISAAEKFSLLTAIGKLPEIQANLIVLHYLHDQPLKDVALALNISRSELSVLHHRALITLRRWTLDCDGV